MWTHGNSLRVETPESLESVFHVGWGTQLHFNSGQSSWLHITVPTPTILSGVRTELSRVFLLFTVDEGNGYIKQVHLYDGPFQTDDFGDDLFLQGEHWLAIDKANTFVLKRPHVVAFGVGISFFFQAAKLTDKGSGDSPLMLQIAGARAEFFDDPIGKLPPAKGGFGQVARHVK
jgi:hypothetical protein